ncbi:YbaB/EbfC family nucleoid-associated protein [Amycolatopsis anabasis]|uniref:YbaB/EbfC family nucleoid-associated protein n=1 Tax=Amycolatopsis anabasis TaxID=1840409 RepID=UPI00131EBE18|nr:YbaB/EbfC family nucleoid-associated protein [Amycolatopsis anabasis]
MVEEVPIVRTTKQLIADAEARQEAFAQVHDLMASATGTAHDRDNTIEVTVDARGKLQKLWLAPAAVNWGPARLGELIVEVAEVAMREATQNSYNKVALLLGEDLTYAIEQLSGMPAPARAEDDDPGMTVEEFQRQRELRLRGTQRRTPTPAPAPEDDDVYSFDPASLRSDR